ncbi:MAG: hypothetical protein A2512_02210 [Deltaproteobacteria bacterium RIFOXYD12_FULL_56_24]|nr:MAG: hypothetical protein A2512_02210 [Deltaproteobacteria bacterium RIFOXYD12_FULL_56_24]
MIVKLIDFLRDRLPLVIRLSYVGLALLVVWDVLFVSKEHAHTAVEHIPGFWAVFGFVACVVIIIVSKWYGHLGIMTREDYYDN